MVSASGPAPNCAGARCCSSRDTAAPSSPGAECRGGVLECWHILLQFPESMIEVNIEERYTYY